MCQRNESRFNMDSYWTPPDSTSAADSILRYGGNPNPGSNPAPAAPVSAWQSIPKYGGHRGGHKRRKDGLCAGSPEAIAADRAKDADRKRRVRAAAREAVNYYSAQPGAADEIQTELPTPAPATANGKPLLLAIGLFLAAIVAGHLVFCRKLDELTVKANPTPRKPF
jgi:hypothetical protein